MAKLSRIRWVTSLSIFCLTAAVGWAPACTVSDGDDGDGDAGAGGDDGAGGSVTSGGSSSGGANSGGDIGQGGTADAGAAGTNGGAAGSGAGAGGSEAGAGGVSGVNTCNVPEANEDTALGKTCADYCGDFFSTCASYNTENGSFADAAECLTSCEFFLDAQLCCRAYHVELAAGSAANATTHCPHAAGDSLCN